MNELLPSEELNLNSSGSSPIKTNPPQKDLGIKGLPVLMAMSITFIASLMVAALCVAFFIDAARVQILALDMIGVMFMFVVANAFLVFLKD